MTLPYLIVVALKSAIALNGLVLLSVWLSIFASDVESESGGCIWLMGVRVNHAPQA
ncbi:MAG: hypothetical protein WBA57_10940 [Elainellaceae cyanobacterium]